jgi:hypothetical protein
MQRVIRYFGLVPNRPSTRLEILTGRWLACCAHPVLAWRLKSTSWRIAVCGGYAVVGYVTVLMLLFVGPRAF